MFNVGGGELLVILLIALMVLGPDRLPGFARKAGKVLSEVRRISNGFQSEIRQAMDFDADSDTRSRADSRVTPTEPPPASSSPRLLEPPAPAGGPPADGSSAPHAPGAPTEEATGASPPADTGDESTSGSSAA